jgi:hypothetical protein
MCCHGRRHQSRTRRPSDASLCTTAARRGHTRAELRARTVRQVTRAQTTVKRRDVRSGDANRRRAELRRSCHRLAVGQPDGRVHPCPATGECATRDTSRQLNTHSTELREVCYPWHPWFGRAVAVYEVLVRQGHSVCRCGLEEERNRRSIEIPTWMFEPAACCRLRVMAVPIVGCAALLELKALLRTAPRPDSRGVLQAQHRSLLIAGGADATVTEPTTIVATHALSSPTPASVVSHVATRDSREDNPVAGAAAGRARRPRSRLRPDAGGGT